ncbi:leucyl/phenylalanyl-tRNA--protein transferase [Ectothiorhodospiraceae bacterium 2226]|nr:leucyl/phenylalanyl-tRNA--protein transferase [Ectothiorhodospiraceae bacterium 2226]
MQQLRWLDPHHDAAFPDVSYALREPDGLLALGGDLHPERLLRAYRQGIFPWYSAGQPIMWWSPDPRAVLLPGELRVSRSLRKALRRGDYRVTLDTAFEQVVQACAAPRGDGLGTWITAEMAAAYARLHALGYAHSIEVWRDEELIGGLYGVALGRVFFGESMFSRARDGSKIALVYLVRQLARWGFELIDCQVRSEHLDSLGARCIPREAFAKWLGSACDRSSRPPPWRFDNDFRLEEVSA